MAEGKKYEEFKDTKGHPHLTTYRQRIENTKEQCCEEYAKYGKHSHSQRIIIPEELMKYEKDMTERAVNKMMKFDKGKDRWDLLPFEPVEAFVKILTYGADKYEPNNWKKGNNKEDIEKTFAAMMRHINKYRQGEYFDDESGLPHLWHAFTNLGFIIYFERPLVHKNKEGRPEC